MGAVDQELLALVPTSGNRPLVGSVLLRLGTTSTILIPRRQSLLFQPHEVNLCGSLYMSAAEAKEEFGSAG